MTRRIRLFDTTLRDGEQAPSCSMDISDKLDIARMLCDLRVDTIEAGFAAASRDDFAAVEAIAAQSRDVGVACLARALTADIDLAARAVSGAEQPVIHIFLATSPLHMEHKLHMSPGTVLEMTQKSVAYARNLCASVEFSAEDATRSDRDFLTRVFGAAIAAGADVVNIADTVGYSMPEEMGGLVSCVLENTKGMERAALSVHCHNDLGMAVANTLSAIRAGASQVDCTLTGIGERAGNAALEEIVMAMRVRDSFFEADTRVDSTKLYPACRLVASVLGSKLPINKAVVGKNAFAHESGIHQHGLAGDPRTYEIMTPESVGIPQSKTVLGKHSGSHAFCERLSELGFVLTEGQKTRAFEQFKRLADKKQRITDKDIVALVQHRHIDLPGSYELVRFVINTGNAISSSAELTVSYKGETLTGRGVGDGPVEAAYNAMNRICGRQAVLQDYSLRSVTEGRDALGEAVVKITADELTVTGRGLSGDVIEASIKAYINGINKLNAEWSIKEGLSE